MSESQNGVFGLPSSSLTWSSPRLNNIAIPIMTRPKPKAPKTEAPKAEAETAPDVAMDVEEPEEKTEEKVEAEELD